MAKGLRVGIIADSALQQHTLRTVVGDAGLVVGCCLLSSQIQIDDLQKDPVDAWVLDIDFDAEHGKRIEPWLIDIDVPVIYGEGKAPNPASEDYQTWSRRVKEKLWQLSGTINLSQFKVARYLWVLAASTGGPEAVLAFLAKVPADLDVAFLYVQHIEGEHESTLVSSIERVSQYKARIADHGAVLERGTVTIISAEKRADVIENRTVIVTSEDWPGPYSPSVDTIIANVARVYGANASAIIFSGMGNDGASGSRLLKRAGGSIWAQTSDTCACSSMPDAAVETGCVDIVDDPEGLADAFNNWAKALGTG